MQQPLEGNEGIGPASLGSGTSPGLGSKPIEEGSSTNATAGFSVAPRSKEKIRQDAMTLALVHSIFEKAKVEPSLDAPIPDNLSSMLKSLANLSATDRSMHAAFEGKTYGAVWPFILKKLMAGDENLCNGIQMLSHQEAKEVYVFLSGARKPPILPLDITPNGIENIGYAAVNRRCYPLIKLLLVSGKGTSVLNYVGKFDRYLTSFVIPFVIKNEQLSNKITELLNATNNRCMDNINRFIFAFNGLESFTPPGTMNIFNMCGLAASRLPNDYDNSRDALFTILLKLGLDPNTRNKHGHSLLQMEEWDDNTSTVDLLLKAGAKS